MSKFIPQYQPVVKLKYIVAVVKQMLSGWVGCGKTVENFEKAINKAIGYEYVAATTSGTMALYLAIAALEIPKNKKILFPSYTFLAGANVAKLLGYKLEFIDVNENMCMDVEKLRERLDKKQDVGAVIYVDHNGFTDDTIAVRNICGSRDVYMIEDAAQGLGMFPAGATGHISIVSFSVPKLVTTGQGGAVMTGDYNLFTKIKQLRDHGDNWRATKLHENLGLNLKFNDILAAYGIAQLNKLWDILEDRKYVFDCYREHIKLVDNGKPSTWMVIYKTDHADKIIEALKAENIQAVKYYRPIPSNPVFKTKKKFPMAEYIYEKYLYLPSSLNLKRKDIDRICNIITRVEND